MPRIVRHARKANERLTKLPLAMRAALSTALEPQSANSAYFGGIPCGFGGVDGALTAHAPPE